MKDKLILPLLHRDTIILNDLERKATRNKVNLHYYKVNKEIDNIGDYLSVVIVDYMKKLMNVDDEKQLSKTKHLYAVGSIIQNGFQNATIWGSGFLNDPSGSRLFAHMKKFRKLDIRAVRGPNTYNALRKHGYECPAVFGDPAILMPLIYKPMLSTKKKDYSVICHMADNTKHKNRIDILTNDYKKFIDEIVGSKMVISSSLHGIILSEAYGIPAILYRPSNLDNTLFKFEDYYFSTERMSFPIARSIEDAMKMKPCELPDFREMQESLIKVFPRDLYL